MTSYYAALMLAFGPLVLLGIVFIVYISWAVHDRFSGGNGE